MTILLDQCVPRRYVRLLKEWGYPAEILADYLPNDSADPDVIALAQRLGAVLLTADLDFASILEYPPEQFLGIIVLRYKAEDEGALDATLKAALTDLYRDGLNGKLVIVAPTRYRVRG